MYGLSVMQTEFQRVLDISKFREVFVFIDDFFHSNQTKEERTFTKSAGSSENARRCQITIKVGKFHFRQKMESSG